MVTVGVRELKNQLSAFLRLVQAGETVVVMDHSVVVAEMKKPVTAVNVDEKIARFISHGLKKGTVLPAKRIVSTVKIALGKRKIEWKTHYEDSREG